MANIPKSGMAHAGAEETSFLASASFWRNACSLESYMRTPPAAGLIGAHGSTAQHCLAEHVPPVQTAPAFLAALPAGHVKLAHVGGGGVV